MSTKDELSYIHQKVDNIHQKVDNTYEETRSDYQTIYAYHSEFRKRLSDIEIFLCMRLDELYDKTKDLINPKQAVENRQELKMLRELAQSAKRAISENLNLSAVMELAQYLEMWTNEEWRE